MAKEKPKMNGRRKRIEFKKIIVIGYAYLSQGKHITTELNRLLKPGYKGINKSIDKKRWNTNLVNRRGQIRRKRSV